MTKAVTCLSHNQEAQSSQHSVSSPTKEKAAIEPKKRESKKEKRIFKKESSEFGSSSISTVLINPIIPQYPFEMYAFGEMYSDDGRLMKRRGPRTTIKQNQVCFGFKHKRINFFFVLLPTHSVLKSFTY